MEESGAATNAFTEDGTLLHAHYAIKSINKAGTTVGMVCKDGIILLGINKESSEIINKIYQLNDTMYCAVAGNFGDNQRVVKLIRLMSAQMKTKIDKDPKPSVLCRRIGMEMQQQTQCKSKRPLGVSHLYSGYEKGEYVLYTSDPSGTINRVRAYSFGEYSDLINSKFITTIKEGDVTMEEGLKYIFKVLSDVRECVPQMADLFEILCYSVEGTKLLPTVEIERIIENMGSDQN